MAGTRLDLEGRTLSNPRMAEAFVDLSTVDPEHEAVSTERIRRYLPQRHEFELVGRVCFIDREQGTIVAWTELSEDDWWAKGHFPGRPLVPGILMVEGAAQVATVLWKELASLEGVTIGFGGLENVRFRGKVEPPARMFFLARADKIGSRMAAFPTQALVDGKLVFHATILGVAF